MILSNKSDTVDPMFKKQIESQWLSFGFARSKGPKDLRRALDFADVLENPRQRGLAYYHVLRRVGIMNTTAPVLSDFAEIAVASGIPDDLMSDLTPEQRSRLMRGLWCLDSLRCYSLANVAFNDRHPQCSSINAHQRSCQAFWRNFWVGQSKGFFDFGLLLESAFERASKRNEWSVPCWNMLKPKIEDMIRIFEDSLSTYFMVA